MHHNNEVNKHDKDLTLLDLSDRALERWDNPGDDKKIITKASGQRHCLPFSLVILTLWARVDSFHNISIVLSTNWPRVYSLSNNSSR